MKQTAVIITIISEIDEEHPCFVRRHKIYRLTTGRPA